MAVRLPARNQPKEFLGSTPTGPARALPSASPLTRRVQLCRHRLWEAGKAFDAGGVAEWTSAKAPVLWARSRAWRGSGAPPAKRRARRERRTRTYG